MEYAKKHYLVIIKGKKRDKAVEALLDSFIEEEKRKEFYQFFRDIEQEFNIISPDAFLVPYHSDYDNLIRMYKILKESYEPGIKVDREFSRKTAELVRLHTKGGELLISKKTYKIDEQTLQKVEKSEESEIEKVFNLVAFRTCSLSHSNRRKSREDHPILYETSEEFTGNSRRFKENSFRDE